jgi:hypothetical protein
MHIIFCYFVNNQISFHTKHCREWFFISYSYMKWILQSSRSSDNRTMYSTGSRTDTVLCWMLVIHTCTGRRGLSRLILWACLSILQPIKSRGRRDRVVAGFTPTYAISAYHHKRFEFEPRSSEVYSTQEYVIKFLSDLRSVCGFLRVLRCPPPIKRTATI